MPDNRQRPSLLADLVDMVVQIQRDDGRPEVELHRRDRTLLAASALDPGDRLGCLREWVEVLRRDRHGFPGLQVQRFCSAQSTILTVLGLLVGWGAAAAAFAYDGSRPVNVVQVLAVFVGLQLLLLCGLAVVLLPLRISRRIPPLARFQEMLLWLSPGQLSRLMLRMLPERAREMMHRVLPFDDLRRNPLGNVVKWWLVRSAQVFGVAFYVGALGTAIYLVAFSDLAFAWSTTLQTSPEVVQRVTDTLSVPWAGWLREAVPSELLIRETQYYRQSGAGGGDDPARWGEWWPFLIAAIVTYGLLPRVGLLVLAMGRFRRFVRRGLLEMPGSALVWDRLTSQVVTTQAGHEELEGPRVADPGNGIEWPEDSLAREFLVVNWGGLELGDKALAEHIRQRWSAEVAGVMHAGGRASVEADAGVIAAAGRRPEASGVAILLKGWEPPVLEALDFLRELREGIGPRRLMVVCLVGWDEATGPVPPAEAQCRQWQRRLRSIGDPALAVRPWPGGPAS